jgi:hypothetical protein
MVFKKGIAFLLIFLLLVSNAGFAMTVHYCGGKVSSIAAGIDNAESCEIPEAKPEKSCCAKKIETGHKKCCSDKVVHFKGKTGELLKAFALQMAVPFLAPVFKAVIFTRLTKAEVKKFPSYYCDAHAPPLFKQYHQYIFYA